MASLPLDKCPHCLKENVATTCVYSQLNLKATHHVMLFHCNNCDRGIVAEVKATPSHNNPGDYPVCLSSEPKRFKIIDIYPKPQSPDIPGYLPDNVKKYFLQAVKTLKLGFFEPSSVTCRKILEVSCRKLSPGFNGTLYQRIEHLADKQSITPDMKAWAHNVRVIGNEAAHDDEPVSEKDAQDIFKFVDLFLRYIYTLPGMLEERKSSSTS